MMSSKNSLNRKIKGIANDDRGKLLTDKILRYIRMPEITNKSLTREFH